jgi:Sec-independent protein secretion pathway component TatC
MKKLSELVGAIILIAAFLFALGACFAFPVKWLWNWLMPAIFHLPTINAWQAWGLNVLSGFWFRSTARKD